VEVGGAFTFFSAVGGPAFVHDLEHGRRAGTYAELCDFIKLCRVSISCTRRAAARSSRWICRSQPPSRTHYAQLTLTDKNWQPWAGSRARRDGLEMIAIALGVPREELWRTPVFTCIINTNSPLMLDVPMAEGLIEMARHGQAVVVTPFTLAGAMAPVTLAGAIVQQNAEALAGITLTQCVRAGAPVMYGAFTTNVDMRSVLRLSARRNMCRRRKSPASSHGATICRSAPAT
jgi:trimethylamine--corrinoid protein Co-methyltransferase